MDVLIIEKKTGRIVTTVGIVLGGLNYTPTEGEYFEEAWRIAVDDKIVKAEDRGKYDIKLRE